MYLNVRSDGLSNTKISTKMRKIKWTSTISEGNINVGYVDYHYTAGYIYWSDYRAGRISRYILIVSLLLLQLSSFISNTIIIPCTLVSHQRLLNCRTRTGTTPPLMM
jgi:hypothetical protein